MQDPKVLMGVGGVILLIGLLVMFAGFPVENAFFGWMAIIAGGLLLGAGFYKFKQENY